MWVLAAVILANSGLSKDERRAAAFVLTGKLMGKMVGTGENAELTAGFNPIADDPGIKRLNGTWSAIQQKIHDSRETFAEAFEYGKV